MILWVVAVPLLLIVMILATAFGANIDAFPRAGRIGRTVLAVVLLATAVFIIVCFTRGSGDGIVSVLFVGIPALVVFAIGFADGTKPLRRRSRTSPKVDGSSPG